MGFAENLRERRLACHMTMESLAILVGTSRQTIQRYESGRIARPPYERIEALAVALGVTPSELMGWQGGDDTHDDLAEIGMDPSLPFVVVADDAMAADRILERDTVYYRAEEAPPNGALAVVEWEHTLMVRRIWYTATGVLLLASNSAYPPIFIPAEKQNDLAVLGTATVLRSLL